MLLDLILLVHDSEMHIFRVLLSRLYKFKPLFRKAPKNLHHLNSMKPWNYLTPILSELTLSEHDWEIHIFRAFLKYKNPYATFSPKKHPKPSHSSFYETLELVYIKLIFIIDSYFYLMKYIGATHYKTGYQLYYAHRLADLKTKPDFIFEISEFFKLAGAGWRNLPKEEKEVWISRAEEEKKENSKREPAFIAIPSKNKHSESAESCSSSESYGEKKHKRKRDKQKDKNKSKSDKKFRKSHISKNESESSESDKSGTESDHSSGRKKQKNIRLNKHFRFQ
ncbi:unnamed protein product [Blepharisma stoltei]|uniref:HMG box domain-containing protein n=1 Tax=Blepharisma stoltei TaxID=1481888 RepID=A0AAU9JXN1_9CILI|nr:unnamed protein product [Blepharisma stoltei]